MIIIENEQIRIVEIWLTNEEKQSLEIAEQIQNKIQENKSRKFKVVIFISGEKDLCSTMENLIIKNKKYS